MNLATDNTIKTPIVVNHGITNYAMASTYHPTVTIIGFFALVIAAGGLLTLIYDLIVSSSAPGPTNATYGHMHKSMQMDYIKVMLVGLVTAAACVLICQMPTQTLTTSDINKTYDISIEDTRQYLPVPKDGETQTQNIKFKDAKGVEHDGTLTINNKTTKLHYDSSADKALTTQPQSKDTTK